MDTSPEHLSFSKLRIMFMVFAVGQVAFAAFAVLTAYSGGWEREMGVLSNVAPMLVMLTAAGGFFMYGLMARQNSSLTTSEQRIAHFQRSNIVRWAMIETGNLFALVALLTERHWISVLAFGVGLLVFLLTAPTEQRWRREYGE
jgi:hypothetical protein